MSDTSAEYAAALAAFKAAQARLAEAKRNAPPSALSPQVRHRQRKQAARAAEREAYTPEQRAADTEMLNRLTAKSLYLLHQRLNFVANLQRDESEWPPTC